MGVCTMLQAPPHPTRAGCPGRCAQVCPNEKGVEQTFHLGFYPDEETAARTYDGFARRFLGAQAKLNFDDISGEDDLDLAAVAKRSTERARQLQAGDLEVQRGGRPPRAEYRGSGTSGTKAKAGQRSWSKPVLAPKHVAAPHAITSAAGADASAQHAVHGGAKVKSEGGDSAAASDEEGAAEACEHRKQQQLMLMLGVPEAEWPEELRGVRAPENAHNVAPPKMPTTCDVEMAPQPQPQQQPRQQPQQQPQQHCLQQVPGDARLQALGAVQVTEGSSPELQAAIQTIESLKAGIERDRSDLPA